MDRKLVTVTFPCDGKSFERHGKEGRHLFVRPAGGKRRRRKGCGVWGVYTRQKRCLQGPFAGGIGDQPGRGLAPGAPVHACPERHPPEEHRGSREEEGGMIRMAWG